MKYKFDEKEHMHSLDDRPLIGTSTACKILAKPLTWWASGLAVAEMGWQNGKLVKKEERLKSVDAALTKIKAMDVEEYQKLLDNAYKAHSVRLKSAASGGVDLHAELEKYVKMCIAENNGVPIPVSSNELITEFVDWSVKEVSRFLFSEIHTYSEKLWLGGIVDAGAVLKDGTNAIIDFKSAKAAYFDHFVQVALYSLQLEENGGFTCDGVKILEPVKMAQSIIIPFGTKPLKPAVRHDASRFMETARAVLMVYKHTLDFEL